MTGEEVREFCLTLPRTELGFVRDRARYRIGRIVYAGVSRDEDLMGFAFPKEERADLVASEPEKFRMPPNSDLRYNWVVVRLEAIDLDEMRELLIDAWTMCVPKSVNRDFRVANGWPLADE